MFSLSFWEVFLCVAIALIVLKPEDVPVIAKQVGKFVGKLRSYFSDLTDILDDSGKPRTKTLIADDGLEYEAYSVDDVMEDLKKSKTKKTTKNPAKKSKTKKKASVKPKINTNGTETKKPNAKEKQK